jgi:hypothetical protein
MSQENVELVLAICVDAHGTALETAGLSER